MRTILIAAAALLASACTQMVSEAPASPGPGQSVSTSSCEARGGTMERVGRMQSEQCVIKYADAGKPCTDGDQCAGDCRVEDAPFPAAGAAASGRCQVNNQPFGCHASVEDGKATAALCVD